MSGLEGLSIAANVMQVVGFGTHFLHTAWQMYHSDSVGTLVSDLQQSSASLRDIQQELQDSSTKHASDKAIRSLVERSAGILQELLDSLETIGRGDRGRKRDALRKTFLKFWNESKLKDLQGQLDSVRDDLSLYLTINLRTVTREKLELQEQLLIDMRNDIKDLKASAVPKDKEKVKDKEKGLGSQVLDYLTLGLLQEQKPQIQHDPKPSTVPEDKEKTLGWQVLDYLTFGLLQQQKLQMKHDLLNGIMANIHKADDQTDPVTASTIQVSPAMREKLEQAFINTLRYDRMTERESTIKEAHEKTFRWIFEDDQPSSSQSSSFKTWLETEDQLYWITGKAGSGKSTMMRYICQPIPPADGVEATGTEGAAKLHARCEPFLQRWAGSEKKLTVASFYFWAIGEKSQATQDGFFRTMLVQLLQAHPDVIPIISPSRWESFCLFNEDTTSLTKDELRSMFRQAVASIISHAKVALFVDGLDEFDGDCRDLISLLKDCTSSGVKVCIASRPWNEFSDAFGSSPSLKMEEFTRVDIINYVETTFETDANFRRLRQRDTKTANKLAKSIVNKADGVFLWVTVVVASLLAGMRDGDRPEDLETRLDLFPSELESLYGKIFDSIDPMYLEHAAKLFKLMSLCIRPPSLMLFWYADEVRFMERSLEGNSRILPEQEKLERLEDMRRRLRSRCKGLIEVHDDVAVVGGLKREGPELGGTLRYLHKTVSEFLLSPTIQKKLNYTLKGYDANLRLAAASVAVANMVTAWRFKNGDESCPVLRPYISSCMHYASNAFPESKKEVVKLIDGIDCRVTTETVIGWDSSRAIWRRTMMDSMRNNRWKSNYSVFTDLDWKEHLLCMTTKALVLQYTKTRAEYGCLLKSIRDDSYQTLSLLSLPPLTDSRSPEMFKFLLCNGAKMNLDLPRILSLKVLQATPWEEVLAKAIRAFGDGVGDDEKANVSKCVRLMIDKGAKVKDETVQTAFKLAHEARICDSLEDYQFLHDLHQIRVNKSTYEGISQRRVLEVLKDMKKHKDVEFSL